MSQIENADLHTQIYVYIMEQIRLTVCVICELVQ